MLPSKTLSLTIPRNWVDLYETIWKPDFFPQWASGLSQTPLEAEGNHWVAKGPKGTVKVRFSDYNPFGIMDHWVDTGLGREIYLPMRVIANQEGADVAITVYRQPFTGDARFAEDIACVERDLQALHTLMTT